MKISKRTVLPVITVALVTVSVATAVSSHAETPVSQWSVQVTKVDVGDVNLEPAFQAAIYENLVSQLSKTKRFKQVFRDGDHGASGVSNLLTLKTTIEKYSAGSETKRAVTTIAGATKLTVRSQLCTRDGKIVLERTINGNVRFMGSNLRATHNLAHNVAKAVGKSELPQAPAAARENPHDDEVVVVELR